LFLIASNKGRKGEDELLKKRNMKMLKLLLICVQSGMFGISMIIISLSLSHEETDEIAPLLHNIQYNYTIIVFTIFLIAYLVVFILLT
jgi:hypothetical protein